MDLHAKSPRYTNRFLLCSAAAVILLAGTCSPPQSDWSTLIAAAAIVVCAAVVHFRPRSLYCRGKIRANERVRFVPRRRVRRWQSWVVAGVLVLMWAGMRRGDDAVRERLTAELLPQEDPNSLAAWFRGQMVTVTVPPREGSPAITITTQGEYRGPDKVTLGFVRPFVSYEWTMSVSAPYGTFTSIAGERREEFSVRSKTDWRRRMSPPDSPPEGALPLLGIPTLSEITLGPHFAIAWPAVLYNLYHATSLAIFGLLLATITRMFFTTRRERRRLRLRAGLCPGCRYPRTVPHTICPECGEKQSLQLPRAKVPAANLQPSE